MGFVASLAALKAHLAADAETKAWATANYRNPVTVKGFVEFTDDDRLNIPDGQIPYLAFVVGGWRETDHLGGASVNKVRIREFMAIGIIRESDFDAMVARTLEFEEHVSEALADIELVGVTGVELVTVTEGGNAADVLGGSLAHPYGGFYIKGELYAKVVSTAR